MPRGGGGFRGGGGGFSGGGFRSSSRSSSFRSSSPSFRSSSHSRPYGRTGARRTTSSSSRSRPYNRTYHSNYRRPYYHRRHYHRPYYYRSWWYRPYFWGRHYRPWYYSPVYVGGGLVLAVVLMMVFLPLMGLALAFPFSSSSSSGVVNYRSTETLNFNEYWYEYEALEAGAEITYDIQSSSAPISFIIADHSFDSFSNNLVEEGNVSDSFTLGPDEYRYHGFYGGSASFFEFSYTATENLEFIVVNGDEFNRWLYYNIPTTYADSMASSADGTFFISDPSDVYLVWYNEDGAPVNVEYDISYRITGVYDFSDAEFSDIATTDSEGSITVPEDGTYYFFVFFDPMNANDESVSITFDVTYDDKLDSSDQWASIRPNLIWIAIIALVLILVANSARKKQKAKGITANGTSTTTTSSPTTQTATTQSSTSSSKKYGKSATVSKPVKTTLTPTVSTPDPTKCTRCGCTLEGKDVFCPACGKKKEGRKSGGTTVSKELKSKVCSFCGKQIQKDAKFCMGCGSKIQR